jgi:transcriptional regulator with XRE-family HTH domain
MDSGGLTRLEQGRILNPRPRTLCAIATALDSPAADLFALAGYIAPCDLPSIEHYLNTKYSHIPKDHTWKISQAVERLSAIYQDEPPTT